MESVVALVAEWISLGEMFKRHELSTPISDVVRECGMAKKSWNRSATRFGIIETKNRPSFCTVKETAQPCKNRPIKKKERMRKWLKESRFDVEQVSQSQHGTRSTT